MHYISQNYGLLGGTLDATELVIKGMKRLCFPSEITELEKLAMRLQAVQNTDPAQARLAPRN